MQKCKECREVKNIKDFYPYNKSVCKECLIKRSVIWMKTNPDRVKKTKANPDYKKNQAKFYREWYAKHGRNRTKRDRKLVALWHRLNPEKYRAYNFVQIALKSGKLKIPKYCSQCRKKRKLNAHHDDYEFPLKIRWLCYSCHKKEHNNLKKLDTNLINPIF